MVADLPDHPIIWTDGSGEPITHLDVEIAGAAAFSLYLIVISGVMPKT